MRRTWASEALDLQATVRNVLTDLGGVDLARSAEDDPHVRTDPVGSALGELGVLELDPFGDEGESSAAALAVRACGESVAPWPLARALSVPGELRDRIDALYLVDREAGHLEHADMFERAVAVELTGPAMPKPLRATGPRRLVPLDPFGVPVETGEPSGPALPERALFMSMVLDGFWVSGALNAAVSHAVGHARSRRQFGRAIGRFGEIRWRLADMTVAGDGLEELATYTWFLVHRGRATLADALALRVGMQEAADTVLRNAHQVLGAIGLCEEHDLAVIDRHLTPVLLRPAASGRSAAMLRDAVDRLGFAGIFDLAPRAGRA